MYIYDEERCRRCAYQSEIIMVLCVFIVLRLRRLGPNCTPLLEIWFHAIGKRERQLDWRWIGLLELVERFERHRLHSSAQNCSAHNKHDINDLPRTVATAHQQHVLADGRMEASVFAAAISAVVSRSRRNSPPLIPAINDSEVPHSTAQPRRTHSTMIEGGHTRSKRNSLRCKQRERGRERERMK